MTILFDPPENQGEVQGYLTPERTGADGKPRPIWWMPRLRPIERRDTSRKAVEHSRAKKHDRKTAKRYRTSRERLDDLTTETQED